MRSPVHALIVAAIFLYCMSLYPAVLEETERTGCDAPIYWKAGRGDTEQVVNPRGETVSGYVYSSKLLGCFGLFAGLDYVWFLFVLHCGNSIGVACLAAAALNRMAGFPILAGAVVFVVGAKASDIVSGGNLTGVLCGMSLTPWGALLAAAVKPHYMVAVVLHAAAWFAVRGGYALVRGDEGR